MNSRQTINLAVLALAALSGCGKSEDSASRKGGIAAARVDVTTEDNSATTADAVPNAAATPPKSDDGTQAIDHLSVLSPADLDRKIYETFGAGLTSFIQGGKSLDYTRVYADSFVGSISNDPNNKYASGFSIGYFLALAGLSELVSDNYVSKVFNHTATNDCTTANGAAAIMGKVAPAMTADELTENTALLLKACTDDPAAAVKAVIQSYSFVLKGSN